MVGKEGVRLKRHRRKFLKKGDADGKHEWGKGSLEASIEQRRGGGRKKKALSSSLFKREGGSKKERGRKKRKKWGFEGQSNKVVTSPINYVRGETGRRRGRRF